MSRLAIACLALLLTGRAAAQAGPARSVDSALTRVDSLISADRLADARSALAAWSVANPEAAGADRAVAGILRGRLARSWKEAEEAWLATAVGYPVTPQAPEALLRLGQGLVSAAQAGTEPDAARRAVAWLQRLVHDYPTASARPAGYLWLARALLADGRTAAACSRLEQAPVAAADSVTASLIEAERRRVCNGLVPPVRRP
jgi:transcriptional regulator GlxA family with amidase domain